MSVTGISHFLFVIFLRRVLQAICHQLVVSCPIREVGINFPLIFLSIHWGSAPYYVWCRVLFEFMYIHFVVYEFILFVIIQWIHLILHSPRLINEFIYFYQWIHLLHEFIHTIYEFIYLWFSLNSYNLRIHLFASTHNLLIPFFLAHFRHVWHERLFLRKE